MGPTKTLAKVANHLAKKHPLGCCILTKPEEIERTLKNFPIHEVWGIGNQWSQKLSQLGIKTAWDLTQVNPHWIRNTFNVILARTALELKGVSCLSLEETTSSKKSLISSRSFGKPVTSFEILREAVSFHASSLAQKLRQQKSTASLLSIFIRTNRFHKDHRYYTNSCVIPLLVPSQDTAALIKAATSGLGKIFKDGFSYKKAGVMVLNLLPENQVTPSLFEKKEDLAKRKVLLKTFDDLNQKFGKGSVVFASEGFRKAWQPKAFFRSPSFTQDWNQLPHVK